MNLTAFLGKWDNGTGWRASWNDGVLHNSELEAKGGRAALLSDLQQLAPADQRTVTRMIRDDALRDDVERTLAPNLARFMQGFDANRNRTLELSEIGLTSFQRFRTAALALDPQTRRQVADRVPDSVLESVGAPITQALPEALNPLDFGAARFLSRPDRQLAEKARTFVRDTLHQDPTTITDGLRLAHLGARSVPATPAEAIARDLRDEIGNRSMNLLELGRYVEARSSRRAVTLAPRDLADGLAQQPQRFNGRRFEVTGYALQTSHDEGKDLTYSLLKDEWVRVPYVEATARLGEEPGATGASVEVFERQEGSTLFSGFWISLSDPETTTHDATQRARITGVVSRASNGKYRLVVERSERVQ